eukprot:TRINITY_DN4706_c0_g4_i1.p1 TRINITY_DN4706_c0_g4~~TRINITY_DN4706_c0_g4_i1.p1  ORF type:complete len:428 (+),score=110.63 TRINITY_DN4706_c0_g4_i1:111-1394(+)
MLRSLVGSEMCIRDRTKPQPLLPDRLDYRSMVDMAKSFYAPEANTENPFCRIKFRYFSSLIAPKARGSVLLGLVALLVLVLLVVNFQQQQLDEINDEKDTNCGNVATLQSAKDYIQSQGEASKYDLASSLSSSIQACNLYSDLYDPLQAGMWAGLLCSALYQLSMIPAAVQAYKKTVFDLRAGKPGFYVDHDMYSGYHATCFYGAYISYVALGFIFLYIVVTVTVWTMAWEKTRDLFWNTFFTWLFWWGVAFALDFIWLRRVLFQELCVDGNNRNWIKRPWLYALVDTTLTCYYIPMMAGAAVFRTIYIWCFAVLSLARIDVQLIPHGGETFDTGFCTFTSVLLMHERQRHPVLLAFFDLLSKPALRPRVSHVARNRWRLALLLLRNPSLRQYRRRGWVDLDLPEEGEEKEHGEDLGASVVEEPMRI